MTRGQGASAVTPPADRSTAAPARGLVTGQIVDAETGDPLPDALVVLVPRPDGVLTPGGTGPSPFAAGWRTHADAAGRYRFIAPAAGAYRLHASRLGYSAGAVDVTVADAAPEVSLGLQVAPLALRAVEVRASARAAAIPRARDGSDSDAARLGALDARQRAYLTTDARELTGADVGEAVTLAESDLFRASHRLPGVSTRDEWAAELWTRGARPDQTRVLFDGLPLFSPVAAFGAFAAVSADAVGAVTLLPGVRPAAVGEGGAAVLDVHTLGGGRFGGRGARPVNGVGEVGVASARLALDGSAAGGRAGWMVAARRSYFDGIARLAGADEAFPAFGDLAARGDVRLSRTQSLAVSGLLQHTHSGPSWVTLRGSTRGAAWGNRVLRATHASTARGLRVTHTLGGSAYVLAPRGLFDPSAGGESNVGVDELPALETRRPPDVGVSALLFRGELAPDVAGGGGGAAHAEPAWRAGYEVARQRARYAGAARGFFTGGYFWGPQPGGDSTAVDTARFAGGVTVGAVWAQRRWSPAPRLTVEPGLRLEVAGGRGAPLAVRPSPRVAARFTPDAATRVSAALGRSVQYTQALPPVGVDEAVRFYPGALWLTAGRPAVGRPAVGRPAVGRPAVTPNAPALDVPALTTDLATLGAERWLGAGWLASVNAYARRTRGLVTHDPAPGLAAARALLVVGRERGRGVELSARRLGGRTTATFAYSWGASTLDAGGRRFASPQDRTHAVDATVSRHLGARWRVGGAFSAASGTPYARTVAGYVAQVPDAIATGGAARDDARPRPRARRARRVPQPGVPRRRPRGRVDAARATVAGGRVRAAPQPARQLHE